MTFSETYDVFSSSGYFISWGFEGGKLCSAKANAESCPWARITPCSSMGWGPTAWVGTDLVDNPLNVSQQCALVIKTTSSILGCISKPVARGVGEVTDPTKGHQGESGGWRPSQGKGGLQGCWMAMRLPKAWHS